MCYRIEHSSLTLDLLEKVLLPITVAVGTYLLFRKLDDYKKRKNYSILGAVIVDSFIEEVGRGLEL